MALEVDIPSIEPSGYWAAVTTSDTNVLTGVLSVYVGTAGDLVAEDQSGHQVTFAAVPAGAVLPIRPTKILIASTASNIVVLK
jgi:hypothetical protein